MAAWRALCSGRIANALADNFREWNLAVNSYLDRSVLSPQLERELRGCARPLSLAKSQTLFAHGSAPNALYCVEKGLVRLSVTASNGREAVLSVVEPGRWFGEASLFTDTPHDYNARAVVASDLLRVPAAEFHEIVDPQPAFVLEFARLVSMRYKWALQRIDATTLQPFPLRLAQRLLAAHQLLPPGADALRFSQEELSHMLGVSRQSVNRQLKEWETSAFLRLEYGRITLLDSVALERLMRAHDLG